MNIKEIRKLLSYEKESGIIRWKKTRNHLSVKGSVAGSVISNHHAGKKYISIRVLGRSYLAHRLAWAIHHGIEPCGQIDHIDGNGLNNSISNLRVVDNKVNHRNMKLNSKSTTGITGVHFLSQKKKWKSYITVNYKVHRLGHFDNLFDACCARKSAELKFGFHKNHGSDRPL